MTRRTGTARVRRNWRRRTRDVHKPRRRSRSRRRGLEYARMSEAAPRVTYATLAAGQSDEFRRRFDDALEELRPGFGHDHAHLIDGTGSAPGADSGARFEDRSPADTRVLL